MNQFKAAYVGSSSHSAKIVERITRLNPTQENTLAHLVEEFSTLGTSHLAQPKIQEQFDNTVGSNLLEGQTSTRGKN